MIFKAGINRAIYPVALPQVAPRPMALDWMLVFHGAAVVSLQMD